MLTVSNLSLNFNGQPLFKRCRYQIHTRQLLRCNRGKRCRQVNFLKILSGELESSTGEVSLDPKSRMSVLKTGPLLPMMNIRY